MTERPAFEKISSHEEFQKYYWYRAELAAICKNLGIDHTGVKTELKFILLSLCRRIWGYWRNLLLWCLYREDLHELP